MILGGLRQVGPHIWVGGANDKKPDAVVVDVRNLPERGTPTLAAVNNHLRQIDAAVKAGKDVLVKCRMGISRSPTIAYLWMIGRGEKFRPSGSRPNAEYAAFARRHYDYYKARKWAK